MSIGIYPNLELTLGIFLVWIKFSVQKDLEIKPFSVIKMNTNKIMTLIDNGTQSPEDTVFRTEHNLTILFRWQLNYMKQNRKSCSSTNKILIL